MKLPTEFVSTITNTFGVDGEQFLADLPALIDEASARWSLTNIQPVSHLSYNFVAFARKGEVLSPQGRIEPQTKGRGDPAPTSDVLLKIGVPRDELTSEMAALRLFNGDGACRLIDSDEERGFLLLERLTPGVMLATLEDDDEATHIAAEVMKKIWRPDLDMTSAANAQVYSTSASRFIQLTDWFDGLKRLREMFSGGTGPLDAKLVDRVEHSVEDFFAENHMPVLMHGDFHHFNILSSERGWLVIDPKGVIGPAGYEVGPLMMNPWGSHFDTVSESRIDSASFSDGIDSRLKLKRRIEILREHLGFERERIVEWSLAHAILSAWWGIEDNTGWDDSLQFARLMADL